MIEALFDNEGEAITRVAINKALEGDTAALRLCLDRFYAHLVKRAQSRLNCRLLKLQLM